VLLFIVMRLSRGMNNVTAQVGEPTLNQMPLVGEPGFYQMPLVEEPLRRFPLVGAAQSRVSDTPLPAEGEGDVCLKANALPLPQRSH